MRRASLELLERRVSLARPVKPESLELQAKLESLARPVKLESRVPPERRALPVRLVRLVSLELLERPV